MMTVNPLINMLEDTCKRFANNWTDNCSTTGNEGIFHAPLTICKAVYLTSRPSTKVLQLRPAMADSQNLKASCGITCACGCAHGCALGIPFPPSALPTGVLSGSEGVGYLRHVREGGLPHLGDEAQLHTHHMLFSWASSAIHKIFLAKA